MRTLKLTIAYDGTDYVGWQSQANGRSVQQVLESGWQRVTQQPARITASGRTDAGVHAAGQVCSLNTTSRLAPGVLRRAVNANTPDDLQVLAVEEMPAGFHAIRDAVGKRYRYTIQFGPHRDVFSRRYAWWMGRELNVPAMRAAASALVGQHDFASFQASGAPRASTVRHVTELSVNSCLQPCGEAAVFHRVLIDIEADGFLYNMVRNIMGTLVQVGLGREAVAWPGWVLGARRRSAAGPTAPAHGLCLWAVHYPPAEHLQSS